VSRADEDRQEAEAPATDGVSAELAVAEPEAEPEPSAHAPEEPAADAVAESLAGLASELSAVARRIDELVRLGDRREQLIDRLHAENQRLRAGEAAQVQAPLLRELIRTHDLIVSLSGEGSAVSSDLELVRRRLLDGLESAGARPIDPEAGAPFDAARHAAIERVETSDPELDMTIARTVRVGFVQDGERVLRPADVAVHRYR
jgi:molecular chaperone GrpE (heat shock protein)